jgi:hypothetical protein
MPVRWLARANADLWPDGGAPDRQRPDGDKVPQATRKQAIDLQAAILSALRKRNGGMVIGEGTPG